jgi:peroxiredoxin
MRKIIATLVLSISTLLIFAQAGTQQLAVGSKAPSFNTKSSTGKFNLKKALKNGPVIVMFYRGNWCPYCNKQLKAYTDSLGLLQAKGAQVIAISPETLEGVDKTVEKTKTTIPIISDKKLKIAKAYNVNFTLDEKTIEKYKGYGLDLNKLNGENGNNLPVPATYIIAKDGTIKFAYFNTDYSKRVSVATLLENL